MLCSTLIPPVAAILPFVVVRGPRAAKKVELSSFISWTSQFMGLFLAQTLELVKDWTWLCVLKTGRKVLII